MNDTRVSVKGRIVAPHSDRREITISYKRERDKVPLDKYPITHNTKPEGIGVLLVTDVHECPASFHRHENGDIFIGSATRRLRSRDYAKIFREFLEKAGLIEKGKLVELEFDGYEIYVSQI